VPTRDRPEALRRCLAALARQTCVNQLEVLVVDDGSLAAATVQTVVADHAFARLIRIPKSGPASARNTGVSSVRADYVCLTDDDCEPSPTWADRLVRTLEAGADAVAGRTVTGDLGSALGVASDLIAEAPALVDAPSSDGLMFAPSNNLACRVKLLTEVRFDERYPVAAGEDRDWCRRIAAKGYVLRSEPDAVVAHRPQSTVRAFLRQQVRYGRGAFWFRRLGAHPQPLESPGFYAALLRRSFRHGLATGVLVAAGQVTTAVGYGLAWARERKG
jgi:glycosyltransferase involved in cell wall biosynthesis